MNSLLQALISLGPFQKRVAQYQEQLEKGQIGRQLLQLVRSAHTQTLPWDGATTLIQHLQKYNPNFGLGQESASEALVFLLDRLDKEAGGKEPFSRLFEVEYWRVQVCPHCGKKRERNDRNTFIDLFGMPKEIFDEKSTKKFVNWLEQHTDHVEDYHCTSSKCNRIHDSVRLDAKLELGYAPQCLWMCFGAYRAYGQSTYDWWFPAKFTLRAQCTLTYYAVAIVEHSGNLSSGHYWAKALRIPVTEDSDNVELPVAYALNDLSVVPIPELVASRNTYLVFYSLAAME